MLFREPLGAPIMAHGRIARHDGRVRLFRPLPWRLARPLSLLLGLLASHYTEHGPQVGIDFQVRFARPVRPGDTIELKWVVTHIEPKAQGSIVTLDGTITNQNGEKVLTSVGKIMTFNE